MEKRASSENELEELKKFKREVEQQKRTELMERVLKAFPKLEIKDSDTDAYLRGILLGYENLKEKTKKKKKVKPIPSETGESEKPIPDWKIILDS